MFQNCFNLKEVKLPSTLTEIGSGLFSGCAIEEIEIPKTVKEIGWYAFSDCKNLKNINLPEGLENIGARAFSGCTSLTEVIIPNSVTSIGSHAFDDCNRLTSVYYKSTAEKWAKISIGSTNGYLINAIRYYYSENEPTTTGNYWYYDENGNPVVW